MSWGYDNRISSIKYGNHFILVPLDHGLTTGFVENLNSKQEIERTISIIAECDVPGIVVNKGLVKYLPQTLKSKLILQTMGAPQETSVINKFVTSTLHDAISLNASMISVQTFFSDGTFLSMATISSLISRADSINMPVLLMINNREWRNVNHYQCAIRYGVEIGASLIKINPANIYEDLIKESQNVNKFEIPLLLPGGNLIDEDLLTTIKESLKIGYNGICIGRGIFQNSDPLKMVRAIYRLL